MAHFRYLPVSQFRRPKNPFDRFEWARGLQADNAQHMQAIDLPWHLGQYFPVQALCQVRHTRSLIFQCFKLQGHNLLSWCGSRRGLATGSASATVLIALSAAAGTDGISRYRYHIKPSTRLDPIRGALPAQSPRTPPLSGSPG